MIGLWRQNRAWFRWASASSHGQIAFTRSSRCSGTNGIDEAMDLASRLAAAAEAGRVDLNDLGRRARRLLATTTRRE
ncbi:MAG: hypothetical protein K0R13_1562 [Propionibacteriaceae bacterium]|nr:hypothetical protein [Propionibacteriaceae bacterium]